MMRPTVVLPVKLIFLMSGSRIRLAVMSGASAGACAMTLRTPAGRPASWKHEAMAQKARGESSEALRMAVFPAAMGYAMALTPRMYGAFLVSQR
jgi:hypothetical protein